MRPLQRAMIDTRPTPRRAQAVADQQNAKPVQFVRNAAVSVDGRGELRAELRGELRGKGTLKVPPRERIRIRLRCKLCGRPRANYRKFGICRICFRKLALDGKIPGVVKSSW